MKRLVAALIIVAAGGLALVSVAARARVDRTASTRG